jgi:hypothetical protein
LTTKRNIKSYCYSKLKPKYNAVWKTEIFNDRSGNILSCLEELPERGDIFQAHP